MEPNWIRPSHLPVVQQPPIEHRAGPVGIVLTALVASFIIMLVFYGLTREPEATRGVSTPSPATSIGSAGPPAPGADQATGQSQPQQQGAQAPGPSGPNTPATTGQAPNPRTPNDQSPGPQAPAVQAPAPAAPPSGDAATGTTGGPSAKPAPELRGQQSPVNGAPPQSEPPPDQPRLDQGTPKNPR